MPHFSRSENVSQVAAGELPPSQKTDFIKKFLRYNYFQQKIYKSS